MILTCFVALLPCLCGAAPTGHGIKVSVGSLVPVQTGQSTTLPCWLDPPQSAEGLEIQWTLNDHDESLIMVYKESRVVYAGQNTPYEGRVSFGTKDAASGGLASGDLSLRLVNVTVDDAADYRCYVRGDQDFDQSVITLAVYKTGSPALLSAVWRDDNTVNVSCESGGWYPEPRLQWRDSKEALTAISLKHSRDSSGLVSVHSWLLVSSSSKISCSVGVDVGEAKEASVYLATSSQHSDQCSAGGSGWAAFTVLLIAILAALGLLWFKKREIFSCERKVEEHGRNGGTEQPLLGESHPADHQSDSGSKTTERKEKLFDKNTMEAADVSKVQDSFENVKFAWTLNPHLSFSVDVCKVRESEKTTLTKVTCLTALTGATGFTSGQHYWEVSMKDPGAEVKKSWWLGVTRKTTIPQWDNLDPSVSNGFWFLSSSSKHFQFNTEPHELLPKPTRPETIGVYLDCGTGELSFYNVEEKSLIGSLTVDNGGELYPLFNPGLGDQSSMRLIHRDKTDFLSTSASVMNSTKGPDGADVDNRVNEQEKEGEEPTLKPEKNDEDTSTPEKNGEDTSTPEKNEEDTSTPEKNGEDTSTPEKNGEDTSTPEKNGEDTSTPEKIEQRPKKGKLFRGFKTRGKR
ncbi:butyrophilin subfamily 2 member A1-like isoform X2 [Nelusetta ayraudi]|uniref:butyrophilin subfamily 2 member A1-like isoform X2 n=1 Tax=Nelusetta ayraudi TaxID=303726 RepID=UPI003F723E00